MRAVRLLETSRMNNSSIQRRDPEDLKSQISPYSFLKIISCVDLEEKCSLFGCNFNCVTLL
jgi:hypothetical protein